MSVFMQMFLLWLLCTALSDSVGRTGLASFLFRDFFLSSDLMGNIINYTVFQPVQPLHAQHSHSVAAFLFTRFHRFVPAQDSVCVKEVRGDDACTHWMCCRRQNPGHAPISPNRAAWKSF